MAKARPAQPAKQGARKKPRRKMRGALTAIGSLLIASAVLRAMIGAGEAIAKETDTLATAANAPATHSGERVAAADMGSVSDRKPDSPVQRVAEDDLMPLLDALNKREARIRKREEDIDVRLQALTLAEQEIDRKLAELEAAEGQLRETLALARTAAEDDITRLTDVYANMKPKQAAALFEQMDPEFAAGFLARMRPDAAAAVMAGLTPGTAYTISVVLAGRNADVPKE